MTCSLYETAKFQMSYNFSPDSLRANFGGSGEIIIFCPPNKKICVWEDFQGELISVSPPNIEIGVRDHLDYSLGQSLLVRRDLT